MQSLTLDITQYIPKSKRVPDPIFEQKRLIESEMLPLINSSVKPPYKPITALQYRIRMNDAGLTSVESQYQLLAEMKQAKSPGACWGANTKKKSL